MAPNRATAEEEDQENSSSDAESEALTRSPSASEFIVKPVLKRGPEPDPSPNKRRKTGSNVSGELEGMHKGRVWSEHDEVAILQGMIDFKAEKGADTWTNKTEFHEFLLAGLKADVTKRQVSDKVRRLKKKYYNADGGDEVAFGRGHAMKLVELCKRIWGGVEAGNSNGGDDGVGSSSSTKKSRKSKAEDDRVCTVLALPAGKRETSTLEKKEKKKKNKKKKKAGVDVGNNGDENVDDVNGGDVNMDNDVGNGGDVNVGVDVGNGGDVNVGADVGNGGDVNVGADVGNGGDVNVDDVVENGGDVNGGDVNVDNVVGNGGDVNVDDDVGNGGDVNVGDDLGNGGDVNVGDDVGNGGDAPDDGKEGFWSRYPFLRDSVELGKRGGIEAHFMRLLPLVGDSNAKMLDARWRELQLLETDLISKKLALSQKQNDLIGDALKSRRD